MGGRLSIRIKPVSVTLFHWLLFSILTKSSNTIIFGVSNKISRHLFWMPVIDISKVRFSHVRCLFSRDISENDCVPSCYRLLKCSINIIKQLGAIRVTSLVPMWQFTYRSCLIKSNASNIFDVIKQYTSRADVAGFCKASGGQVWLLYTVLFNNQ